MRPTPPNATRDTGDDEGSIAREPATLDEPGRDGGTGDDASASSHAAPVAVVGEPEAVVAEGEHPSIAAEGEPEVAERLGRYRLLGPLGEGGMGTVFAAVDEATGAAVAIKTMSGRGHDARRFDREIAVLAGLQHPRIVRYLDHGTAPDGRRYLVMERLRGEDLRAHLARRRPSVAECVELGIHVAEALLFAHARGTVHRDIKPSNVFLVDGAATGAKILDFGVARGGAAASSMTGTGAALGTVGYMAPEQARGDPRLDHRADLFALGCVLYEALAGQPPFVGEHAVAILAKILLEEPRPLRSLRPEIPEALAAVIHQALAKRPEDRPSSAAAILAVLRACVDEVRVDATSDHADVAPVVSYREQEAVCLLLVALESGPETAEATVEIGPSDPIRAAAAAHGASVTPLLGGAEILAFELDGSIVDVVARAARCALEIVRRAPMARQVLAVGRGEQRGDSVVGQVLDALTGLLAGVPSASIVVDGAAARALGPSFEITSTGEHYRLLAEREGAGHRLLGRPSPFVGRSREIGRLTGIFQQVVEEARCEAVVVTAEAGVGKSRLCRELLRGLEVAGHDLRVLGIRCAAVLSDTPLGALGAALRGEAGVIAGDPPEEARRKVLARFRGAGPSAATRVAFLGELCGVDLGDELGEVLALARRSPAAMADAQRLAWLDWLESEAAARPLVILVEDLHWCDDRTADFLRAAATDLAERPVLVLVTARPEAAERFPPPWPGPTAEQLVLGPIHARASEMLVRQAMGSIEAEVAASLVARAGGNPFFLEELVRAVDDGDDGTLPDSVLAVVQARLRRLDEESRRLLRAASVFDGAFEPGAVARLLGAPISEVQRRIDALVAAETLAAPGSGEGVRYRFNHALVRDAAHAMLSDADRLAAHRAAAAWLAEDGGYEPAVIAGHYALGDALAEAAEWYVRAARRALACADVQAAAANAERALGCGVDGRSLAEVRLVQADLAIWAGDLGIGEQRADEALGLAEPASDPWYAAIRRRIHCAVSRLQMDVVRQLCEHLSRYRGRFSGERALCLTEAAYAYCIGGALEDAAALLDELTAAEPKELASPLIRASIDRVRSLLLGQTEQIWSGLVLVERSIAPYEEGGDLRSACRMRVSLAWILLSLGAAERAERVVRDGLRISRRVGAAQVTHYLEAMLIGALLHQRRITEALPILDEVVKIARARGEKRLLGVLLLWRAGLDDEAGVADAAVIDQAREGFGVLGALESSQIFAQASLARLLARHGELAEAVSRARDGLVILGGVTSTLDDEWWIWASFIEVLERAGLDDEADPANREALARIARLRVQIEDPELQRTFAAHPPVVALLERAQRRGLHVATIDAAIA